MRDHAALGTATAFDVLAVDDLAIEPSGAPGYGDPCVWRTQDGYAIALRTGDSPSGIVSGTSEDGVRFRLDGPVIAPDSDDDAGGASQPALVAGLHSVTLLYVGGDREANLGRLLWATGEDVRHLEKRGRVLPYVERDLACAHPHGFEAENAEWRLYFDMTDTSARLGFASASHADGPWFLLDAPFSPRPGAWDSLHASPGPVVEFRGKRVMFYNGCAEDDRWRIGWLELDDDGVARGDRSAEPIAIDRPAPFAHSAAVAGEDVFIYASDGAGTLVRVRLRPGEGG